MPFSMGRRSTGRPWKLAPKGMRPLLIRLKVLSELADLHRDPSHDSLTPRRKDARRRSVGRVRRASRSTGTLGTPETSRTNRLRRLRTRLSRSRHPPRSRRRAQTPARNTGGREAERQRDHRRRTITGAGSPSERRHHPRRRADRRSGRPFDGAGQGTNPRTDARAREAFQRCRNRGNRHPALVAQSRRCTRRVSCTATSNLTT